MYAGGMKKKKPSTDVNVTAFQILKAATGQPAEEAPPKKKPAEPEKNPAAVALGRLGGLKGGKARAEKLSTKKRSEIAKKASKARWDK
ncbi:MAG: hypothetical protein OJF47_002615 [Nitrospira sp.]|jgi:hypothetical protein|nr:MAG: hypothetical protein OJF47_002615 [Nitrospira sp.]